MSSNPQISIGVTAIDQASSVLSGVDRAVLSTAKKIEESGNRTISKWGQIKDNIKAHGVDIAVGIASLSAGVVSFATSFDVLEKAQLATDKAQLALTRSQEHLEKLQSSGKATAEQLAIAQEQVRLNTEKVALSQDAQNDTYMNFLANIPSQIISMGMGVSSVFTAITSSTISSTLAMHGFRLASIAAFITNPVGIAIIGISALVAALVFNIGGLRDMVFKLGDAIMDFLDAHFKPLADAIRWFLDNVAKPLGNFFGGGTSTALPESITRAETSLANYDTAITNSAITTTTASAIMTQGIGAIETGAFKAANAVADLEQKLKGITGASSASSGKNPLSDFAGPFGGQGQAVASAGRTVNLTNFSNPAGGVQLSARVAQKGLDEFLNQDTVIFAHKGEHARITPAGHGDGNNRPIHIHFEIERKEIAHAIINDIEDLLRDQYIRTSNATRQRAQY